MSWTFIYYRCSHFTSPNIDIDTGSAKQSIQKEKVITSGCDGSFCWTFDMAYILVIIFQVRISKMVELSIFHVYTFWVSKTYKNLRFHFLVIDKGFWKFHPVISRNSGVRYALLLRHKKISKFDNVFKFVLITILKELNNKTFWYSTQRYTLRVTNNSIPLCYGRWYIVYVVHSQVVHSNVVHSVRCVEQHDIINMTS